MSASCIYLIGLAVSLGVLTLVWLVQLKTEDASPVDVAWSWLMGGLGALFALAGDAPLAVRLMLGLMASLWGLRLGGYLALRMRGQPEDSRYAAARASWGKRAPLYMLLFFWFQAVAAWLLALPFLVVAFRPDTPSAGWLLLAALVWLVSVVGEALADHQLHRFKRDPANRGHVCRRGLWRYSRHPNYFFESLHWVSYLFLAIGAPYWWATLASPVIMAWLLLRVSGIPTVESREGKAKRIGYDDYVRTTSAFIPWPPKA